MTRPARVVLDASVLFAAAGSPQGGSSTAIGLLAGSGDYQVVLSAEILREALGNVRLKLGSAALGRLYTLLATLRPVLVAPDASHPLAQPPPPVAAKDEHVVRSCLQAGASVCLTLDRRHLLTADLRRWAIRHHHLRLLTPGEFLAWVRLHQEGDE